MANKNALLARLVGHAFADGHIHKTKNYFIYVNSNKVGKQLAKKGAPVGSKVLQAIRIPEWIINGATDIKSAFLSAIYDDEGYFRDTPTSRQIVFKAASFDSGLLKTKTFRYSVSTFSSCILKSQRS